MMCMLSMWPLVMKKHGEQVNGKTLMLSLQIVDSQTAVFVVSQLVHLVDNLVCIY